MAYTVLIIGCGAIAGGYDLDRSDEDWPLTHAGAITRSDRFKLTACVDPDDSARAAFAARWNVPTAVRDLEALDAQPGDYDLIVIASPTELHPEHLRWALDLAPKAVFCEKPVSKSFDQNLELAEAFQEAGIPVAVNYTRRWAPDIVELAQGWHTEWGEFISAVGTYSKGILHNGSHLVDLIEMILSECEVCFVGFPTFDHWDGDPSVSALLGDHFESPRIHLVAGDCRAFTQFELVLTFEKGEVAIRDGGMRIETRRVIDSPHVAGYRQLGPVESSPGRYPEAMTAAYANIADAIETGATLASSDFTALHPHDVCDQIYRIAMKSENREPSA